MNATQDAFVVSVRISVYVALIDCMIQPIFLEKVCQFCLMPAINIKIKINK